MGKRKTAVTVICGDATTAGSVRVFDSRDEAFTWAAGYADCIDSDTWHECIKRADYDVCEALIDWNDCIRRSASVDFSGVFVGRVQDE